MKGDAKALDQAFYAAAMEVLVQDGNLATTKQVYEHLLATQDELFRGAALDGIGASRRTADAQWLLAQFKDTRLRSTDKLDLMQGFMAEEETRDLAFDWLKANYDEFAKGAGIFAATAIPGLPKNYCSLEKAREVDQLLRPRVLEAKRGELPFNRMIENIQICGSLKKAKTEEIAAALKMR
jgi:hypothetical protein